MTHVSREEFDELERRVSRMEETEARLRQQIAETAVQTQQKTIAAVEKLHHNSPGRYLPR